MAKIKLFKKISIISAVIIFLIIVIFSICLCFAIERFNQIDASKSRQYFSLVQNELSQNQEPQIDGVNYAVVSLDGKILKSTINSYAENQTIELKLLAGIDESRENGRVYFAAPFLKDDIQVGTLILLIDSNLVRIGAGGNIVLIVFLSGLFVSSLLLILRMMFIAKKDIAIPLEAISRIAKKMAGGDYSEKLLYDYTDEIGQLCHDIEILRDELLSSRHRESELKKNEKFLLACISHDLKTPLAIIAGTAESLKDNIVNPEQAAVAILNKTNMLGKLIDDILEQTKTELGEFSINRTECYAKEFFEKELKGLQSEAQKKGLIFIMSACPECIVSIDKQRIFQVMHNLIGNALKYTPKGGTITVSFEIKDNELIVSVKDTGAGISAQDLPFIFDKFFRGEKARSPETSGSGLGLPIAKYIIEKHCGKIDCDTILGKGTEMRFSLPLDKE